MDRRRDELIEDPQWVSRCVEEGCPFGDRYVRGYYVCSAHLSKHSCSGPSCAMIWAMASRVPYRSSSEESCPVAGLLTFRKAELDFRGPCSYYDRAGTCPEVGYGALECGAPERVARGDERGDVAVRVLQSCLPAAVALFSVILTYEFAEEYEALSRGRPNAAGSSAKKKASWASRVFRLADEMRTGAAPRAPVPGDDASAARDAALKSVAALSTLFSSRDDGIGRFVKKMVCQHNDKDAKTARFYTSVVMAMLCFFPYLKHRALSELFDDRVLVLMFFDKSLARHGQWSALATRVHLHVKQPDFAKMLPDGNPGRNLPVVVAAALDGYFRRPEEDVGAHREPSQALRGEGHRGGGRREAGELRGRPGGKRKSPCLAGYYEAHRARLEEKRIRAGCSSAVA